MKESLRSEVSEGGESRSRGRIPPAIMSSAAVLLGVLFLIMFLRIPKIFLQSFLLWYPQKLFLGLLQNFLLVFLHEFFQEFLYELL